ncbi:MAG: type II toxin-antitoxin system VapC family toxin [Anaerolineales bacterium]
MSSSTVPPNIVIDANIAVKAILPIESKSDVLERMVSWHRSRSKIFAPELLFAETVSVIRRGIFDRWITEEEGQAAIVDLYRLGVEIVPSDVGISQAALAWAGRLGQSKAYDGFYLAVAERQGAELWTADEKLVNRAKQLNITWIRWIDGK